MNQEKQIEELNETLSLIYAKNIEFLKKDFPLVYNKIVHFENQQIQKSKAEQIQNYSLDFINNTFQLTNIKNQTKFYKEEPFTDAINRVNNFDISSAFSLIKLEQLPKRNHYENEINSYLYLNSYIKNFENITIEVNKFIFIGTLLGVHLNDFHKSLKAKVYLIIEPNIEIFRLSLFLCDYETIANSSKIFFAISENENALNSTINSFLDFKYEYNNLIFYELAHNIYEDLIPKLTLQFNLKGEMRYPFSDFLISLKRGYKYFFEYKKSIIKLSKKHNFLEDKKVLFLGAGVSLAKNLEWVYLNQEKFILVASSAVLKHLRILDIIPDIIIALDGQKQVMLEQFNVDEKMYKNSIILASIKLDDELFSTKLKDTDIFFMQNSLELFSDFGFLSGVTVGDLGVDILAKLGSKQIFLLGVDACFDSKSGKTHIGTHISSRKVDIKNSSEDIVYIKGNFQKQVPASKEYLDMCQSLEEIINKHKNSTKVYNFGSGAYFKGSEVLKTKDFKANTKISKEIFKKEFLNNLQDITKQKLEDIDIKDIQQEKNMLKKINSIKTQNFFKEFQVIFKNHPNSIICNIFDRFFRLLLPYYNILKDKNLANGILDQQLNEVLSTFNSIFDKIDIK